MERTLIALESLESRASYVHGHSDPLAVKSWLPHESSACWPPRILADHGHRRSSAARGAAPRAAGPNIVIVVVDDLGTGDAGCYGNAAIKTSGLDLLAQSGTRFTHAFCTTASCSASRSVLLSGLHNHATGQYGHSHDFHHCVSFPHIRTLPTLLCGAGYETIRTGKYHVAPASVYPFDQEIPGQGASPERMAELCRPVFTNAAGRPFFLFFCTTEPHRPFRRDGSDPVKPDDVIVPPYLPDIPACREELARYYMSVQRADKGLAQLLGLLQETGR